MDSGSDSDSDIIINNKMTPGKLEFINSSSIRNLISKKERDAAEAELEAQDPRDDEKKPSKTIKKKKQSKLSVKQQVKSIIEEYDNQEKESEGQEKASSETKENKKSMRETKKQHQRKDGTDNFSNRKLLKAAVKQKNEKLAKNEEAAVDRRQADKEEITDKKNNAGDVKPKDNDSGYAKKDNVEKKKKRRKKNKREIDGSKAGVIYLGHVPHGFYEKQMREYFSQFGEVLRVRLSRSQKTGKSRGYAFVQLEDKYAASQAAEAMDGYMMEGVRLVAKVLPDEKVHPDLFKPFVKLSSFKASMTERKNLLSRSKDPQKVAQRSKNIQKNIKKKKDRLAQLQINYKFPEILTNTIKAGKKHSKHPSKEAKNTKEGVKA